MANKIEIVVTARPSWARVKSLLGSYTELTTPKHISISLVGPAVSKRYGDVRDQIPKGVEVHSFPTLHDSDDYENIAIGCLDGGIALARHWAESRPDAVLVIADRTETLGAALTASLMQIPLIHLQGGEISGSIDDKIRDTNSKLADLHLTTNENSLQNLIKLGEKSENIFVIGCPSIDLIRNVSRINTKKQSSELGGVGANFELDDRYGIVMFHPDTFDGKANMSWIRTIIESLSISELNWFWFWPNPDHGSAEISNLIRSARESGRLDNVRFLINLEPEVFLSIAKEAKIMVGNSSFGIREASFIGLRVINIGNRQDGREKATNVFDLPVPVSPNLLLSEIRRLVKEGFAKPSLIYGDSFAGDKGARIIRDWNPRVKTR